VGAEVETADANAAGRGEDVLRRRLREEDQPCPSRRRPPPPPARRKPGKQATLPTDKLALPVEIEALIDHADTSEGLAALRFTEGDAMEEAGLGPLFFQAIEKRLKEL